MTETHATLRDSGGQWLRRWDALAQDSQGSFKCSQHRTLSLHPSCLSSLPLRLRIACWHGFIFVHTPWLCRGKAAGLPILAPAAPWIFASTLLADCKTQQVMVASFVLRGVGYTTTVCSSAERSHRSSDTCCGVIKRQET